MIHTIPISRRGWLRCSTGAAAASMCGWLPALAAKSDKKRTKSVIVLWMNGGPATIDMWDLKVGNKNGGPFREIETSAKGLKISEHLPKIAKHGKDLAIVRSMTSKEGDHGRATFYARTGYNPMGAIQFPAVGSVLANELVAENADLPGFVAIAPGRNVGDLGGGFLGPKFAPLVVGEGATGPDGLTVPNLHLAAGVTAKAHEDRLALLGSLEAKYSSGRGGPVVDGMQAATASAARLMRPEAAAAFRLDEEKDQTRDGYGRTLFGQGCLLARRLVERGVPFVEVTLTGWDTHQDNFERVKGLSATLDSGFAGLVADLKERGLLESTVVMCLGEFGRTPKINGASGRDHWPATWSTVLAGGEIKGGQAIGKTNEDGTSVAERPVKVPDLIATVAKAVGIDPQKQNMSNVGRPIRVADPAAKPIEELL